MSVSELLANCVQAVDAEIDAVKLRPARDVLFDGQLLFTSESTKGASYRFKSTQLGLKFADVVKARLGESVYEVSIPDSDDETLTLHLPEDVGKHIDRIEVEWENDFVLRKLREKLVDLQENESNTVYARIERVIAPGSRYSVPGTVYGQRPTAHGSILNPSQLDALSKSLINPVTFIWGPPGTGKTSTLGHIMAELLLEGKQVLFVSNTNRAVDVGLLSVLEHLEQSDGIYRLGDTALENGKLEDCRFEAAVDRAREAVRQQIQFTQSLMTRHTTLQDALAGLETDGEPIPAVLETELDATMIRIKEHGGKKKMELDLAKLIERMSNLDFALMRQSRLVATTLAKVCTSDLLDGKTFDAVVLDEASMASLPYILVMAAKAETQMVIAGDPMQLPPISQSEKPQAKLWMETDIYALASGAKTANDLFVWHDTNPDFTCFFDTQYRMPDQLAALISDVFYEGRLVNGTSEKKKKRAQASPIQVIDTSSLDPIITTKTGTGFQPVNEVHQGVVRDLVVQLVLKHNVSPYEIGIIVPFRSVVWDMRQVLRKDGFNDVEVGTVHTFQGREKQVIIFDTVMSGVMERGQTRHFSVRPFDETKSGLQVPRLLNVAFSRAKENVFLVADLNHMRRIYPRKFIGTLLGRIIKGPKPT